MKKIIFLLMIATGLQACKKEVSCSGNCIIVTAVGKQDTIRNNVCEAWNAIENGQGTDRAGNPVSTKTARLICH